MSGLLAAIMLQRRGWAVDVFERVESELAGRGAGIVAQGELIARLTSLGLDVRDLGVEISTRQLLDREGGLAGTLACPQVLTAWERVYRLLRDAFPGDRYHRGQALTAFEQTATRRHRLFQQRRHRARRRADWRRRLALDGPPAMFAGRRAGLCGVCSLARAHSGSARCRPRSIANWLTR